MFRALFIGLLLTAVSTLADSTGSVSVGTNSTIVIPFADTSGITLSSWVSETTYEQGEYVRNSLLRDYWTPTGGLSTDMPTHLSGAVTYDDGVTWFYNTQAVRRNAIIQNAGTNSVRIAFGLIDAEYDGGLEIFAGEVYFYSGQNQVNAVLSGSATDAVSIAILEEDEL